MLSAILAWLQRQVKARLPSKNAKRGKFGRTCDILFCFGLCVQVLVLIYHFAGNLGDDWMEEHEKCFRKARGTVNMQSLVCISFKTSIVYLKFTVYVRYGDLSNFTLIFHFHFYFFISVDLVSDPCSLEACDHIFCRYVHTHYF